MEFVGKEASKFSNSCKWVWWIEGLVFVGILFVLRVVVGYSVISFFLEIGFGILIVEAYLLVISCWESKLGVVLVFLDF